HDGKRIATHAEDEWLGEMQLPRDPRSEERTDEPNGGGDHESASRSAAKSSADGATDRGDDDQHDEPRQRERHANILAHPSSCKEDAEPRFTVPSRFRRSPSSGSMDGFASS